MGKSAPTLGYGLPAQPRSPPPRKGLRVSPIRHSVKLPPEPSARGSARMVTSARAPTAPLERISNRKMRPHLETYVWLESETD